MGQECIAFDDVDERKARIVELINKKVRCKNYGIGTVTGKSQEFPTLMVSVLFNGNNTPIDVDIDELQELNFK